MEIAQAHCTQNYTQTFNTLSRRLTRMAASSSTITALGGTNTKTRENPGTTLKKTTKSCLLFIWFLFEVYSNNLQQDTTTCHLSPISVFILRANCVVFPVLFQCFHGVPNKKGTISMNPTFLGINALYIATVILNFTQDICIFHLKKWTHSDFVLKDFFCQPDTSNFSQIGEYYYSQGLLTQFYSALPSIQFWTQFFALERKNDLKVKTQSGESQRVTQNWIKKSCKSPSLSHSWQAGSAVPRPRGTNLSNAARQSVGTVSQRSNPEPEQPCWVDSIWPTKT